MESKFKYAGNDDGNFLMPFGEHKGKRLSDLPDDYLYWLDGTNCYGAIRRYIDANRASIVAGVNKNRTYNKVE